jgi:hypothetical protein
MSRKPGRNEPCPCGSGKKYKRCCLATDEAATRERARENSLLDDELSDDFDSDMDDETWFDVEDAAPILDVRDLVRVCYTRGFVNKLSDLRAGHGVRVTEWEGPQIPHAVLKSIEREGIDALEGEWGDPKAGDPIQVDVIDLETENDVVSIHVFNRAIGLLHADSEEMRRIHRACGVLEGAAGRDRTTSDGDAPTAVIQASEPVEPPPEIDFSVLLKEHRGQGGTCQLCGKALTRRGTPKHFAACIPAHDVTSGPERRLVQLRVTAPGLPAYWLDVEMRADAKLDALDDFLRRIWLECCGHLSAFTIGAVKYFSSGYDLGFTQTFGSAGRQTISERSMNVRIGDVLPAVGTRFEYEYDFGSTTALQLTLASERTGRIGRSAGHLLARNTAPVWPCAVCGRAATGVCSYCLHDMTSAFACASHKRMHGCGGTDGFVPVVNSPRMGVCGYGAA